MYFEKMLDIICQKYLHMILTKCTCICKVKTICIGSYVLFNVFEPLCCLCKTGVTIGLYKIVVALCIIGTMQDVQGSGLQSYGAVTARFVTGLHKSPSG